MKKPKILFFLQVVGHPRDSKRIQMLQDEGFEVEAIAFERKYHKGRPPNCKLTNLGFIRNKKYFERFIKILIELPKIRKFIKRNEIIYASGQDVAFASLISGLGFRKPIIMEVGDIASLQTGHGILGKIIRKIDKIITSQYALLIVISEGFLNIYYKKWLNLSIPAMVIKNKLEPNIVGQDYKKFRANSKHFKIKQKNPLRIGYFGLLRDYWSWKVLSTLATRFPNQFEIIFAGYPINPLNIENRLKNFRNMHYLGEYKSPIDLPFIYNQVDMIWACYPEIKKNDWNLKWGRPNRFYESCFFAKPCFARDYSLFAEDVKNYNIGCLIKDVDVDKVVSQISNISTKDYSNWKKSLDNLPPKFFLLSNESKQLADNIRKILNN